MKQPGGSSELERPGWAEWARDCAGRIDPLAQSPSSLLDTPEADMKPIAYWQFDDDEDEIVPAP